ncbi:hypothetical protein BRADI_3g35852v3 [Brachypodium distachyon]|uniref:Uncharacterized protein n=1 Tax=Brachypodium distachyon TaxID=15368 RepID=A0A2K2D1C6_BRADI|nr:hypothetical protein BRADI_3g35852v3 [Brachypodium distachyon]
MARVPPGRPYSPTNFHGSIRFTYCGSSFLRWNGASEHICATVKLMMPCLDFRREFVQKTLFLRLRASYITESFFVSC